MRHRHHKLYARDNSAYGDNCKAPLESFTPPVALQSRLEPVRGELAHFLMLVDTLGVEGAANAYTKDELAKMARANDFAYLNPRTRKIDLAYALTGAL